MNPGILEWLVSHYGQEQMNPGLDRITRAISPLMKRFEETKVIIIAGTNGKGETTLCLSKLLESKSHFAWTSPHIVRVTERFRSEKGEIDEATLRRYIHICHKRVLEEKLELTFYEFLFFVFCHWAAEEPPEYLLLEVGLGGRLDAVNIFDASIVLLPSVSRDHQEILGRRYDEILKEKLGTLRPSATLIAFTHLAYLRERIQTTCERLQVRLVDLESFNILAAYEFSQRNHFLAYAAFCTLNNQVIDPLNWTFSEQIFELRGELLKEKSQWLFFGSHNCDGMRKLIQFLHSGNYTFAGPPFDRVIVAFSRRSTADVRVMMKMLNASGLGKIVVTAFEHPKAAAALEMEVLSRQEGLEFVKDIVSTARTQEGQKILVTGSYYFLGHVMHHLRG
ncbi:MAG TPA: hypothetical protein VNJ01_02330 [Bacteriovoracaceae bacterium]|nr:hypothetical protein [Bacteriovoracaceae bacterium]